MTLTLIPIEDPPSDGTDAMADHRVRINRRLATQRRAAGRGPGRVHSVYQPDPETEEKRRKIRKVAARIAAETGILRLSIGQIARAMNQASTTLTYHYPNREELIADIVMEHLALLNQRIGDAIDAVAPPGAAAELRAFATAFLGAALAERDEHRMLIRAGDAPAAADRHAISLRFRTFTDLIEERLAAHAPALAARPGAASVLARGLLAALSGAVLWLDPAGAVPVETYATMLADMALDGATRAADGARAVGAAA